MTAAKTIDGIEETVSWPNPWEDPRRLLEQEIYALAAPEDPHLDSVYESAPEGPGGQSRLIPKGTPMGLQALLVRRQHQAPCQATLCFTSLAQLNAYAMADTRYMGMPGREFFKHAKALVLIVDPGSPHCRLLLPTDQEALQAGTLEVDRLEKPILSPLYRLEPVVDPPSEIREAINGYAQQRPQIEAVYVMQEKDVHDPAGAISLVIYLQGDFSILEKEKDLLERVKESAPDTFKAPYQGGKLTLRTHRPGENVDQDRFFERLVPFYKRSGWTRFKHWLSAKEPSENSVI